MARDSVLVIARGVSFAPAADRMMKLKAAAFTIGINRLAVYIATSSTWRRKSF